MRKAADEIAAAMATIIGDEEEARQRERYRHAVRVLKTIPSGTPDSELTAAQRGAWLVHDDALRWFENTSAR